MILNISSKTKYHPGRNILGTEETVSRFTQQDFFEFIAGRLDTSKIVFSVVGNISFAKVLKQVEPFLKNIPAKNSEFVRAPFQNYAPINKVVHKEISQTHCAMGKPALSIFDPNRFKLFLLNNILGGPSMNSRLNLALREKYGYVYNVESVYQAYTDTGFIGIFYGTEEGTSKKARKIVLKEIQKIREKKLGTMQLHMAKEQAIGQMAMAEENYASLMLVFGKSLLDKGRIDPLDAIFNIIRNTTGEELQDIANQVFNEDEFSFLTYLPK